MKKLLFLFLTLVVSVAYSQEYWTQYAAKSFESGTGTESDPYVIVTPEQLAKLSSDMVSNDITYEETYFRLDADIDLSGKIWFAIGNDFVDANQTSVHREFSGVFDGNGHKILNLNGEYGLFGYTTLFSEIRNLTIESGTLSGQNMVGGIVGYNSGLIENCINKASVSALISYPGGIAGANMRGEDGSLSGVIRNCVNYGTVSSQADSNNGMGSGGITGSNTSKIEFCANYGDVSAKTAQAGGIAATLDGGFVSNCYNAGKVSSREQAGGCLGSVLARTTQCEFYALYNIGEVIGQPDYNNVVSAGNVVCVFLPLGENSASARNIYGNIDACPSLKLIKDDAFADVDKSTCLLMTTEEMASQEFADKLNDAGNTKSWIIKEGVNAGCPTFEWIETQFTVGLESIENEKPYVDVYGSEGYITVTGADEAFISVYDLSGTLKTQGDSKFVSSIEFERGIYIVSVNVNGIIKNVKVAL